MGYQLVFWRDARVDDGAPSDQVVYESLIEGADVEYLPAIPVAEILSSLHVHFPIETDSPPPVFWVSDDESKSIEFDWSDVHFSAELRPFDNRVHADANQIIDVMATFACPLYDPQTSERFKTPSDD